MKPCACGFDTVKLNEKPVEVFGNTKVAQSTSSPVASVPQNATPIGFARSWELLGSDSSVHLPGVTPDEPPDEELPDAPDEEADDPPPDELDPPELDPLELPAPLDPPGPSTMSDVVAPPHAANEEPAAPRTAA
jgi:hypothetical protein